MSADVHGFEHAALEPEIGVIEIDPATGEHPVVVVNSEQPHHRALQAIKAWRDRLAATPLLAILDLVKEYPLGVAAAAGAAAVVTATSVSVAAIPFPDHPPPGVITVERLEAIQTSGRITPFTTARASTAPPTSPTGLPAARRPTAPARTSRPSSSPSSPSPTQTSTPEPAKSPTPPTRPQATTSPSPSSEERPQQGENGESPSPEPSPQKPTLLPPIDIDVPLIDEGPLVDAVCGLLPIGCPIG